jgi:hypothetical protein
MSGSSAGPDATAKATGAGDEPVSQATKRKKPEPDAALDNDVVQPVSSDQSCDCAYATPLKAKPLGENSGLDFDSLKLAPFTALENADRRKCPSCNKSKKYFCPECLLSLLPEGEMPCVILPLNVHIIQAASESPAKSTAQHAPLLSTSAKIWRPFPECADDFYTRVIDRHEADEIAVLYPSKDALSPKEAAEQLPNLKSLIVVGKVNALLDRILRILISTRHGFLLICFGSFRL